MVAGMTRPVPDVLSGMTPGCGTIGVRWPSLIQQVKFVGICVSDQDRALEFYTKILGFELRNDQPFEQGQRWIELAIPGAETGIVLFTPKGHENRIGQFVNMAYRSTDLQATYEELTAKGVEFTSPPTNQPWGSFAIFKDPDGNSFVISAEK